MTETIIVALITGGLSLIGVLVSNHSHSDRMDAKLERGLAVTDAKLEELTREVRKHNGFAERIPVLEEKITVANKRIADLERQ